ncbi:NAD-dependent protein deacylase [Methanosarcinaceae archaeon]|nr:NAD-dependent protein deacylase [Methanosarcinaceae archaeon]
MIGTDSLYDEVALLNDMIASSDNIVFFGGAGVSTESGIPDYRSKDGLYNQKFSHPPEVMLSRPYFDEDPGDFFRFYRDKILWDCLGAEPNAAHLKLAELEKAGKLRGIITQNIDGLHQEAGSRNVLELHGSIYRNNCMKCSAFYDFDYILTQGGDDGSDVPVCPVCGGTIKPSVVLYGEPLDNDLIAEAISLISDADVLIIGGTSLAVYPAAGLINYYSGNRLVVINLEDTDPSGRADLFIQGRIGEVLSKIKI